MPNAVAQKRKTTLAAETIDGRSAGSVTDAEHLPRGRAEGGRRLRRPGVERLPGGTDRADHHGHVEERPAPRRWRPRSGRGRGTPAVPPPRAAAGTPRRPPRSAARTAPAGPPGRSGGPAGRGGSSTYAAGQPEQHRDRRTGGGRPHGEPQHPVHPRPREHLERRRRGRTAPPARSPRRSSRSRAARRTPRAPRRAPASSAARPESRRFIGVPAEERERLRGVNHRVTMSRHSSSQASRFSAISAGSSRYGDSGCSACFAQAGGQLDPVDDREDVHARPAARACTGVAEQELDQGPAHPRGCRRPSRTPAYSTWRKQVSSSALVVDDPSSATVNAGEES